MAAKPNTKLSKASLKRPFLALVVKVRIWLSQKLIVNSSHAVADAGAAKAVVHRNRKEAKGSLFC